VQEIPFDTETNVVNEVYGVVYAPRSSRKRFPENCVIIKDSAENAVASGDLENHLLPAKLLGPSRSSEGLMLYYLVEWLPQN